MTQNKTRTRQSLASIWLEFLGSMNLAITLLIVVAVASVIGTVLQQNLPYQDYQIQFGPFWFEVFRVLGLYDVYGAAWFLAIMTFLILSVSVCVWRNAPHMLRDIRRFRLNPQLKSLKSMTNSRQLHLEETPSAAVERAERILVEAGYKTRRKTDEDHTVVAGMRGGGNRIGYVLSHVAIVIICVGALIDGNIALKLAELTGRIQIETRDVPASEVPPESTLGPDTAAYRGNVTIPEGSSADLLFLNVRDGYLVQKLPFTIELEAFRLEHYPSGQPKSYESDIIIHDPELDEPITRTISVNDPLIHRGVAIYQASFQDGGTTLNMKAIPLSGRPSNAFDIEAKVQERVTVRIGDARVHLELDNFDMFNVEEAPEGYDRPYKNYGPSFTYRIRDEGGNAREYETFMLPAEFNDRDFFISGVRAAINEPMHWLHIPASPASGQLDRFMRLRELMMERDSVYKAAETYMDEQMRQVEGRQREDLIEGAVRIISVFNSSGLDGVMRNVEATAETEQQAQRMGELYRRVLDGVASRLYERVLEDEGIEAIGRDMAEEDMLFYSDAIDAMAALPRYGAPFFLELENFDHRQASGLQITRAPGQNTVYLGSLLLVIGLFLMFYVAHRRVWVRVQRGEQGTEAIMAGSSNRHPRDFRGEFQQLADRVEGLAPVTTGEK